MVVAWTCCLAVFVLVADAANHQSLDDGFLSGGGSLTLDGGTMPGAWSALLVTERSPSKDAMRQLPNMTLDIDQSPSNGEGREDQYSKGKKFRGYSEKKDKNEWQDEAKKPGYMDGDQTRNGPGAHKSNNRPPQKKMTWWDYIKPHVALAATMFAIPLLCLGAYFFFAAGGAASAKS
eukprot:gnl/TRDRNA2_/TRDRNA2_52718_c0_seq1.p1 gnl/TRDRNA2_/TRDRNA2_52718_c0~~gnl/TRDRNA2_/TRDRNA2_52718_c0_seq1.p1  ORF type:complete len:177 (+),score=37.72 gnl/TRDRNA2_/TRDRNA2_52718_c0_seq1:102-632(+)